MSDHPRTLVIEHAKIRTSPDTPPLDPGAILVQEGQIVEVGGHVDAPSTVPVVDARGGVVVAGFWNSHVHFTEPRWRSAKTQRHEELERSLADMLTSRGFTSAVDLGSDPRVVFPLRRRVATGELLGPDLYVGGTGLFPPHGIPYYLRDSIPWYVRWLVPQPRTPGAATRYVAQNQARGSDVLKLFTGSYVERRKVVPMPAPIARAAASAAHARGQLVFAHSSNLEGTIIARDAGVDVLAHAPSDTEGVDRPLLQSLVGARMAMIPTLKMFGTTVTRNPAYLGPIYDVLRGFRDLGGELWFGTDVGYMTDYSTEGEFEALHEAGLDAREILRMLTITPARRISRVPNAGSITPGAAADLVILEGDPFEDIGAFARVRTTIGRGRVLWSGSDGTSRSRPAVPSSEK